MSVFKYNIFPDVLTIPNIENTPGECEKLAWSYFNELSTCPKLNKATWSSTADAYILVRLRKPSWYWLVLKHIFFWKKMSI